LNWLVKDRILAFAGPSYERHVSPEGYCTLSPNDYIPYFLKKKVSLVVRLNKKAYNEQDFVDAGINHVEAFFVDGSCPNMKILHGVIEAFESVPRDEAFAVHCKAGLGRTGTCVGAYIMKHFRFTAKEVIAWMRICRPGCVIGPQQHFLSKIEPLMWQEGEAAGLIERPITTVVGEDLRMLETDGGSPEGFDREEDAKMTEATVGRAGQADGLLAARGRKAPGTTASSSTPTRAKFPSSTPVTPEQRTKQPATVSPESSSQVTSLWCG
jgi:protein-tyrosine phosphatase